jgi:hypothetical protein
MKARFTNETMEAMYVDYTNGMSLRQIANKYGYADGRTIGSAFKAHGFEVKLSYQQTKKLLADDLFTVIDSDFKAYLLGLILSDGNITTDGNIKIKLCKNDRQLLLDISMRLFGIESVYEYPYENSTILKFGSQQVQKDLSVYGCVPNKTYEFFDYPQIPEKYNGAFIRGYFDGDGSAGIYFYDNAIQRNFYLISVNTKFLSQAQQIINTNCGLQNDSGCITEKKYNDNGAIKTTIPCYCLVYRDIRDLRRIYDFIYSGNTICLNRKKNKLYLCTLTPSELEDLKLFHPCNA